MLVVSAGASLILLSLIVLKIAGRAHGTTENRDWTKLGRVGMASGGVLLVTWGAGILLSYFPLKNPK